MGEARKGLKAASESLPELERAVRTVLSENGEKPERWLVAGMENSGKIRLLCAAPPFPLQDGYNGPLLEGIFAADAGLSVLLKLEDGAVEYLACASSGFMGNLLGDGNYEDEDFPADFASFSRIRRKGPLLPTLRAALGEMIKLGYDRLSFPPVLSFKSRVSPSDPSFPERGGSAGLLNNKRLGIAVKVDGGIKLHCFEPGATLGTLSQAMGAAAVKARLLRLRQGALNCGGCGRCCHDPDIPLTYFDLESIAALRFPDVYAANREEALARSHLILAFPKRDGTNILPAPPLKFRKRDGGSGGSPCVFLDGRGLCGVYEGRPLLCRLYHCAEPSGAVEHLYKSAFHCLEWLGRAVESGLLHPTRPLTLPILLEQPLVKLASPYALWKVAQEIRGLDKANGPNGSGRESR